MDKSTAALAAIRSSYGTDAGEDGATIFVEHHLEELSPEDWQKALGQSSPTAAQVLQGLILVESWDSEDNGVVDTYDYSLPGDVTDYMLSVRFKGDTVDTIDMES